MRVQDQHHPAQPHRPHSLSFIPAGLCSIDYLLLPRSRSTPRRRSLIGSGEVARVPQLFTKPFWRTSASSKELVAEWHHPRPQPLIMILVAILVPTPYCLPRPAFKHPKQPPQLRPATFYRKPGLQISRILATTLPTTIPSSFATESLPLVETAPETGKAPITARSARTSRRLLSRTRGEAEILASSSFILATCPVYVAVKLLKRICNRSQRSPRMYPSDSPCIAQSQCSTMSRQATECSTTSRLSRLRVNFQPADWQRMGSIDM